MEFQTEREREEAHKTEFERPESFKVFSNNWVMQFYLLKCTCTFYFCCWYWCWCGNGWFVVYKHEQFNFRYFLLQSLFIWFLMLPNDMRLSFLWWKIKLNSSEKNREVCIKWRKRKSKEANGQNGTWNDVKINWIWFWDAIQQNFIILFFSLSFSIRLTHFSFSIRWKTPVWPRPNEHTNTSSLGNSNFGHSNINLYNNYASASYATYTAPQYTTANPNRCPANANIKPTSSCSAAGDHPEGKATNKQPLASIRCGHHVLRKSNGNNGGSDTVVANKHERQFNESVIEEGHNNNFVSKSIHSHTQIHFNYHTYCSRCRRQVSLASSLSSSSSFVVI